jgi:hypothetical protein
MSTEKEGAKTLNEKLFNLQQEIGTISKEVNNPFYKSKYFDINSLIKQLHPLLAKHRLLLQQPIRDNQVMSIIICIDTNNGTSSAIPLPEINDPQKLGSAITYYRRYTLASLLGLQADDDDANLAAGKAEKKDERPWLNKNSDKYNEVTKYMETGGDIKKVEAKYKLSKVIKDELLTLNK